MPIDYVEFMTFDTLPSARTPEEEVQLNMVKQLALHPDIFRLTFFHLPADLRLHAKYALINKWKNEYDIRSVNIMDFTQQLITAIHNGTRFSELSYRESDILIVDDLQVITGKQSAQEAFFSSVLKPRLEAQKLTVLFSEYSYETLSVALRDDLRNLLRLGFYNPD